MRLSCPAQAGHPVRRGPSVQQQPSRSTGSPGQVFRPDRSLTGVRRHS
ncbi:hypothetical protein GTH44_38585 [Bradyrhizobium japonicum]|nr:hypothetical protein [Bradyrhizobium japonicum]